MHSGFWFCGGALSDLVHLTGALFKIDLDIQLASSWHPSFTRTKHGSVIKYTMQLAQNRLLYCWDGSNRIWFNNTANF